MTSTVYIRYVDKYHCTEYIIVIHKISKQNTKFIKDTLILKGIFDWEYKFIFKVPTYEQ